jgi:hypothetical protein
MPPTGVTTANPAKRVLTLILVMRGLAIDVFAIGDPHDEDDQLVITD